MVLWLTRYEVAIISHWAHNNNARWDFWNGSHGYASRCDRLPFVLAPIIDLANLAVDWNWTIVGWLLMANQTKYSSARTSCSLALRPWRQLNYPIFPVPFHGDRRWATWGWKQSCPGAKVFLHIPSSRRTCHQAQIHKAPLSLSLRPCNSFFVGQNK